jgi:hypothetical protein
MTKPADDLEAVRTLVDALQPFDHQDQERIIRWAKEKLGLPTEGRSSSAAIHQVPAVGAHQFNGPADEASVPARKAAGSVIDIRTFVNQKKPKSDVQFAATVAYYHRFELPEGDRKDEIGSKDLQEACRRVNRPRFEDPGSKLREALKLGLLDKGSEPGMFRINTVGENLVAMTLPEHTATNATPRKQRKKAQGHKNGGPSPERTEQRSKRSKPKQPK